MGVRFVILGTIIPSKEGVTTEGELSFDHVSRGQVLAQTSGGEVSAGS
jgi:hypothetical protein